MNDVIKCIGDTCKILHKKVVKFVDSVDPVVQSKIEENIKKGELQENTLLELTKKQNELRNKIDDFFLEITLENVKDMVKTDDISNRIKSIFTYYYTEILDRIPEERKNNINDTEDDIKNLDESIKLMYCIELVCNPDDYVLNYDMGDTYTDEQLKKELENCDKESNDDNNNNMSPFIGETDYQTEITKHEERSVFPTGIKRRSKVDVPMSMNRGGKKSKNTKKVNKSKKTKKTKKTKKVKKTKKTKKVKKSKKSCAKKSKKTNRK